MDRKHVSSLVLRKLSDLLLYESVSFLGLEDELTSIESKLRDIVNSEFFDCDEDLAYDIEDAIDVLEAKATAKRTHQNLSFLLADSMDERKLRKKLNRISLEIFQETRKVSQRRQVLDLFPVSSRKQLDVGESIISPVIKKLVSAMSCDRKLIKSPSLRRKARWLRDEMRLLHVVVKELEWRELKRDEMSWMEEVTLFSRSADDIIGSLLLLPEKEDSSSKSWIGLKKKKKDDLKLRKKMDLMNDKVKNIMKRFRELADKKMPPPRLPPNLPPMPRFPPQPFQPNFRAGDAVSLSSFDDDDEFDDEFDFESEDGALQAPARDEQNGEQQPHLGDFECNAGGASSSSSSASVPRAELPDVTSFDTNMYDIMELLLGDDPSCVTISIEGMEGTGKTKLARCIYENPAIKDHFPYRTWVNWVRESNINRFMEQIVGPAQYMEMLRGLSSDRDDYFCRLRRLLNDFLVDKRYLIVVDGVTSNLLQKQLVEAFDGLTFGTRIIFVSSKAGVSPETSDRNFTFRLQLWGDDESWALFARSLNPNIPMEFLESRKGEILRICGGLPKAIVKLAQLLSKEFPFPFPKDLSRILKMFNKYEGPWSETLQEINKNLPLNLRRCLFYFRLFPEYLDQIPVRRLIGLWVAEGFGNQKNAKEAPEQVLEKCLIELANKNMIQVTKKKLNGKMKMCRLPDALRVHWLLKGGEADFLHHNDSIGSSGIIRRLVDHLDDEHASFNHIHGENSSPSLLYSCYGETVSFLSFDTRQGSRPGDDVGNFLQRCISSKCFSSLWVLDLEHVYKPILPQGLGQLTQLRYFGLRSTYLEMLPLFINKLLKLQTLDLKRTHINALPSSIWMMPELGHLFLDENSRCTFAPPPKGGNCLVNLQTLSGAFVGEDSSVRNGLDTFLNISKLHLTCKKSKPSDHDNAMSSQLDAVADWVSKLNRLQSLKLKSFDELGQPADLHLESLSSHMYLSSLHLVGKLRNQYIVSELPENLKDLTLFASGLVEDPMQMLDRLPNLKSLRLFSAAFVEKKMVCASGGFSKLQVLKLGELEELEEWNIEKGALPVLTCLEIRSCRNLNELPDGLQHVKTLSKLKLTDMAVLSARIRDNQAEECDKVAHVLHVHTEN